MKESISLTTIFQIVILFILLFAGIMALTINNSNAFGVKDEIANIIQYNEGNIIENNSGNYVLSEDVVDTIAQTSYRTTGKCETDSGYIGFDLDGKQSKSDRSIICVKCVNVSEEFDDYFSKELGVSAGQGYLKGETLPSYYYEVVVFYQLDLPVIKSAFNVKTKAETKLMYSVEGCVI